MAFPTLQDSGLDCPLHLQSRMNQTIDLGKGFPFRNRLYRGGAVERTGRGENRSMARNARLCSSKPIQTRGSALQAPVQGGAGLTARPLPGNSLFNKVPSLHYSFHSAALTRWPI